ncbi:hypothetical protein ARMSODRAFT_987944 [Armillaria solidipes]|uniref:DUF6589 domain-containing protein n=1 Tax=Armillaria solidipes TaxID=1076256 RepID=A0A2H3BJI5_9AGAR|nr:hypothetical protein ARMSODRAFT_987944 [Armillaria solidipes]
MGPPVKQKRHVFNEPLTPLAIVAAQSQYVEGNLTWIEKEKKERAEITEDQKCEESREHVQSILDTIVAYYPALHHFFDELLSTHDYHFLNQIHACQPNLVNEFVKRQAGLLLEEEGQHVTAFLKPPQLQGVIHTVKDFSVLDMLHDQKIARILTWYVFYEWRLQVLTTIIFMLAQVRNEHSSTFQVVMCVYLLACGAMHSQFNVLNHAGMTLSYRSAVCKIKNLSEEQCHCLVEIVHHMAFMIIWDNLNFAFHAAQQRADSKDHFDNRTTATLVPLYGVKFGELSLDLLLPQTTCKPILHFQTEHHLLPTLPQVQDLETAQRWHIKQAFLSAYPDLLSRFPSLNVAPPSVECIPVHKTKQYPITMMHIDESSLDGTIDVMLTIFGKSLCMSGDGIHGDQLSLSLLDKVCASHHADSDLLDNMGKYLKRQNGVFHDKIASTCCIVNEHWGKPNGKALWVLWKMNSLLGQKVMVAGWKLMIDLVLLAHILDGFQLFCPCNTLEGWVQSITSPNKFDVVSETHVGKLRRQAKHDVLLENIILFNQDALILLTLRHAIKRGDVGLMLTVLTHWMLMFHGCGKMPKYAEAMFHLVNDLQTMDQRLCHAYMMNWLANLTGKRNSFKEMDLLQEHQNFWLKVIYSRSGANRSWKWISMISVSVFILCKVIHKVQCEYQTPYNSITHTNPSANEDIQTMHNYLEVHRLQSHP